MIKNDLVDSICEVSNEQLLIQTGTNLLITKDWQIINEVKVSGGFNLERSLLLPGFDLKEFPFFVDYGTTKTDGHSIMTSQSYNLINVNTGSVDTLVNGSAQNILPQAASFFTKTEDGRTILNFCTAQRCSTSG